MWHLLGENFVIGVVETLKIRQSNLFLAKKYIGMSVLYNFVYTVHVDLLIVDDSFDFLVWIYL
jgi:hypothetical protein